MAQENDEADKDTAYVIEDVAAGSVTEGLSVMCLDASGRPVPAGTSGKVCHSPHSDKICPCAKLILFVLVLEPQPLVVPANTVHAEAIWASLQMFKACGCAVSRCVPRGSRTPRR